MSLIPRASLDVRFESVLCLTAEPRQRTPITSAWLASMMPIIEVHLMAVGGGPTLDYADAAAFLAEFPPMIEMARRRRIN